MENKWKNKTFLAALKNALEGMHYVIKTQRNLKIQIVFAIVAIVLGILLMCNTMEICLLVLTIFFVLLAEFINTAIETVVDLYTEEYNEKAKIAKDVSAGAVVLTSFNAIIIGGILLGSKMIQFLQ